MRLGAILYQAWGDSSWQGVTSYGLSKAFQSNMDVPYYLLRPFLRSQISKYQRRSLLTSCLWLRCQFVSTDHVPCASEGIILYIITCFQSFCIVVPIGHISCMVNFSISIVLADLIWSTLSSSSNNTSMARSFALCNSVDTFLVASDGGHHSSACAYCRRRRSRTSSSRSLWHVYFSRSTSIR